MTDAPYLYGLNPTHPEISSQGLRDREFAIPKPPGTKRIMILGDSVAFGYGVSREMTFAKVLERNLQTSGTSLEVMNTGVNGYTAYNEVQYYLSEGLRFKPDIVIVAFCPNDIVDPKPHWSYTGDKIDPIPQEAIPNLEYHRTRKPPEFLGNPTVSTTPGGGNSSLVRLIRSRLGLTKGAIRNHDDVWYDKVDGKWWPTYITGEDPISIRVLLDYDSEEWRWLRQMYDRLHTAVRAEGATLMIATMPLAYQIDPAYPFHPQDMVRRYCTEKSVGFVDPLPAMQRYDVQQMFFLEYVNKDGTRIYDIWHLAPNGHEIVADELSDYIKKNGLLQK